MPLHSSLGDRARLHLKKKKKKKKKKEGITGNKNNSPSIGKLLFKLWYIHIMVWLCPHPNLILNCNSHSSHMSWEKPSAKWLNYGDGSFLYCSHDNEWVSWNLMVFKRGISLHKLSSLVCHHLRCVFHFMPWLQGFPSQVNCKCNKPLFLYKLPSWGMSLLAAWDQSNTSSQ